MVYHKTLVMLMVQILRYDHIVFNTFTIYYLLKNLPALIGTSGASD